MQDEYFKVGDLIRCWHLEGIGFCFSIGVVIKTEDKYAKVCLQESGQTIWVSYRAMYLLETPESDSE